MQELASHRIGEVARQDTLASKQALLVSTGTEYKKLSLYEEDDQREQWP